MATEMERLPKSQRVVERANKRKGCKEIILLGRDRVGKRNTVRQQ